MKLLQWQRPARRWVLKSPHHLEFLDIIDKQFGNVHYLWTHRDLSSCVPSFLSMLSHGQAIFSNQINHDKISEHWLNKTRYMLNRAMSFRNTTKEKDKFIDIHYNTFINQPMQTIRLIYKKIGVEMDNKLEDLMWSSEKRNTKGKYGSHHYKLEDFGLNEDIIKTHYRDYIQFLEHLNSKQNI